MSLLYIICMHVGPTVFCVPSLAMIFSQKGITLLGLYRHVIIRSYKMTVKTTCHLEMLNYFVTLTLTTLAEPFLNVSSHFM